MLALSHAVVQLPPLQRRSYAAQAATRASGMIYVISRIPLARPVAFMLAAAHKSPSQAPHALRSVVSEPVGFSFMLVTGIR